MRNGIHADLVEVKSGGDYKKHMALDNILAVGEWRFSGSYVLCRDNIQMEDGVTYLPWYLCIFLHAVKVPKGLTYEVDISGLTC